MRSISLICLFLFVVSILANDCVHFQSFRSDITVNNATWCQSDYYSLSYLYINVDIPNNNNNAIPTTMIIKTSSYSRYNNMAFGICSSGNLCNNTHVETNTTVSSALKVSDINFYYLMFQLSNNIPLFNLTRVLS
jgi:hypothetical protein